MSLKFQQMRKRKSYVTRLKFSIQSAEKLEYNEHGYKEFTAIMNNYLYPGKVFI